MVKLKKIGNIKVIICQDEQEVAQEGAKIFAEDTKKNPSIVLGLALAGLP